MDSAPPGLSEEAAAHFFQEQLAAIADGGRWGGLPSNQKRAAPEIYAAMRQGTANIREWFQWTFGMGAESQQQVGLWQAACIVDMRVNELMRRAGIPGLLEGLQSDDILEGTLRQLAVARDYKLHGDSAAARAILALKRPGDSVIPNTLQDEVRGQSQALYKQHLRTRPGRGKGDKDKNKADPKASPKGGGKNN